MLNELSKYDSAGSLVHQQLMQSSVDYAKSKASLFQDATITEVAVDAMAVKLALRLSPHLTGYSHLQANPKYSYDPDKIIQGAKRTYQYAAF